MVVNMRLTNSGLLIFALFVCNVNGLSTSGLRTGGTGTTLNKDSPTQKESLSAQSSSGVASTNTSPTSMTTGPSSSIMSTQSTVAPSDVTTESTMTATTSATNLTTEPSHFNMTTQVSTASTQPTINMSSEVPSNASTSPSDISSQSAMTSSPSHSIPHTTPRGNPHVSSPSKNKFNAWSFLGGVAVGLFVTLVCIGLVHFVNKRKTQASDSVQYKAMI